MVGNDVVDLRDPEALAGPAHPRFDARVFGAAERAALAGSAAPAELRWTLWAAKEAAFKAARQRDARVVFSPRRFRVRLGAPGEGVVRHESGRFRLRLASCGDALHALAQDAEGAGRRLLFALERVGRGADPSRAARALAARVLCEELSLPRRALRFERRGRVPVLKVAGRDADLDLSLSHHGRFVAFACEVPA